MRVSELGKAILALGLLICAGLACNSFRSVGSPHTLKSRDGKFQLTVPAIMAESSTLSKDAEIAATNTPKDLYAFVITKKKSDYAGDMTLDKLTNILHDAIKTQLSVTESPEPEKLTINGYEARRYRLNGTREGVKIVYINTIVETAEHFHQIYTWTDPEKFNENEPILREISDSFQVTR